MESSNSRPYFAIFAIIAIIVAGFILKSELTTQDTAEAKADPKDPHSLPHESEKDWFKRVGWQKLGFTSQEQMDDLVKLEHQRKVADMTPAEEQMLHQFLSSQNNLLYGSAMTVVPRLSTEKLQEEFLPEVKATYIQGTPNGLLREITSSWIGTPSGRTVLKKLEDDPNKDLGDVVKQTINNHDNPFGNSPGGA